MCPAFSSARFPWWKSICLTASLLLPALAARAEEDPLLGQIKALQCVGCTPGSVDLVIHDPIDVRDFQVRINMDDYQKIITPLPGKTVYDKNGCFYWFEAPKATEKDTGSIGKKGAGKATKVPAKKAPVADTAQSGSDSPAPPPSPEIQGTPSRCIPYTRVEPARSPSSGKKKD
jgi:hypothetical protein